MKQSTTVAAVALLAGSALAGSPGSAIVVNACSYDVHLSNVPAMGGGHVESDTILSSGDKWSTVWTSLTNGDGWSIKLSKSDSMENIMQYEYTFHDDGTIWYDLSDVNGNPWDGNWEITADGSCSPKQQAYRFSTDDAYGMQSCADDSTITVTLCSGDLPTDGAASSLLSSVAEAATSAVAAITSALEPATTAAAPSTTTTAAPSKSTPEIVGGGHFNHQLNEAVDDESSTSLVASPTTFATSTTAAINIAPGVTVFEVETAIVTEVVTAVYTAPSRVKRHEHHAGHHNV